MNLILRQSSTDDDMIEIIGKGFGGKDLLWGVVHCDFISDDWKIRMVYDEDKEVNVTFSLLEQ